MSPGRLLVAGMAVLLLAGSLGSFRFEGPWYLPDAVAYLNHSRAIAWQGELFWKTADVGVQPGWPLVLSPLAKVFGHDGVLFTGYRSCSRPCFP